jgi:hypothetical protein
VARRLDIQQIPARRSQSRGSQEVPGAGKIEAILATAITRLKEALHFGSVVIARAENGLDLLGLSVNAKSIATRLMPFSRSVVRYATAPRFIDVTASVTDAMQCLSGRAR